MIQNTLLAALLLVLVSALSRPAAAAKRIDGYELLEQCEKLGEGPGQNYYAGTCAGYIMGVVDSHNEAAGTEKMPEPYFCLPAAVSRAELFDIVLNYIDEHPQQRHFGGATLIWIALVYQYPCPTPAWAG